MQEELLAWYRARKRDLPWRDGRTDAYGVLVSEVMLQQTQVDRVLPVWNQWVSAWPTPAALADADLGSVLVTWGRLGYPRRAARLHRACRIFADEYNNVVPDDYDTLVDLPGIGEYTAAAVLAFAYGRRIPVIDTNVRRVWGRYSARWGPDESSTTVTQRDYVASVLPAADPAEFSVAAMELGAIVCRATATPDCERCPLRDDCAWAGGHRPSGSGRVRRQPRYEGSLRQARGYVLATLRDHHPFEIALADLSWQDPHQLTQAVTSLAEDGLIRRARDELSLPG